MKNVVNHTCRKCLAGYTSFGVSRGVVTCFIKSYHKKVPQLLQLRCFDKEVSGSKYYD